MLAAAVAAILVILLVFLRWLLVPYRWTSFRDARLINKLPGPEPTLVVGNILQLNLPEGEMIPKLYEWSKKYGPIYKMWVLGIPEVFLSDPDDVEVLLNSRQHITKSDDYLMLHDWLGTGLLTSAGEKWHSHRKILTPAFHFKILESYVSIFNQNSDILVAKLREHQEEKHVNLLSFVTLCTLDIICETAMGVAMHSQLGGQSEYVRAVKRMSELFHHRQMSFWLYRPLAYALSPSGREEKRVIRTLHGFTEKVIKERRAEYRRNRNQESEGSDSGSSKKRLTFLDLLIEVSEREGLLDDLEIREEVDTFMFEGHDTTSAAISWAVFLLGGHQDIQDKVVEELEDIFGDSDRAPEYADLMNMKYLEQVIKESLRLYPSVPAFARSADVDIQIKGYTIPAGTLMPIAPYILHRNPDIFPDPEVFNPGHFLPDRMQGRHPFAYLPFSAGPRNCIGQKFALLEEKAVLSNILRHFKVTSLDKMADVKVSLELILRSTKDLKIKLSPRRKPKMS